MNILLNETWISVFLSTTPYANMFNRMWKDCIINPDPLFLFLWLSGGVEARNDKWQRDINDDKLFTTNKAEASIETYLKDLFPASSFFWCYSNVSTTASFAIFFIYICMFFLHTSGIFYACFENVRKNQVHGNIPVDVIIIYLGIVRLLHFQLWLYSHQCWRSIFQMNRFKHISRLFSKLLHCSISWHSNTWVCR